MASSEIGLKCLLLVDVIVKAQCLDGRPSTMIRLAIKPSTVKLPASGAPLNRDVAFGPIRL